MRNFFTRSITGFFLVIIVLGGFILHPLSFILVGLVIVVSLQVELSGITSQGRERSQLIPGLLVTIPFYIGSIFIASGRLGSQFLLLALLSIPAIIIYELYRGGDNHFKNASVSIFAIIYSALPYILMVFISFDTEGFNSLLGHKFGSFSPETVLAFFILVWMNDTGAYLVGITMGRHKLYEKISPKKSWEGFFGGLIVTLIVAFILSTLSKTYTPVVWISIGLITSIGSTYGDLFASLLKRDAGIKDSGNSLPGHGGFLDRFDGVTLSFPLVYLFITFFG